jgi:hypothetical protein
VCEGATRFLGRLAAHVKTAGRLAPPGHLPLGAERSSTWKSVIPIAASQFPGARRTNCKVRL